MSQSRPDALGSTITIKSIEDADQALHELSWILNESDRLNAVAKQKIDALKADFDKKCVIEIDGSQVTFADRARDLMQPLNVWVVKNIQKLLSGKKRSTDRPHGTLGLRQQPLVVEVSKESSTKKVLDQINDRCDIVQAVLSIASKKVPLHQGGEEPVHCKVGDLVAVSLTLDLAAVKAALEEKRITREQLGRLGLVVRDAFDLPVIKPAKCVVTPE